MKDITDLQSQIGKFAADRGWSNGKLFYVYNMIGNLSEETGEIWNVIKWVNKEEDMQKLIIENQAELKDGIGDLLWCIARLAVAFDVDMHEALQDTLNEYTERFPVEVVKGRHGNRKLGGFDGKYDK